MSDDYIPPGTRWEIPVSDPTEAEAAREAAFQAAGLITCEPELSHLETPDIGPRIAEIILRHMQPVIDAARDKAASDELLEEWRTATHLQGWSDERPDAGPRNHQCEDCDAILAKLEAKP